MFFFFLWQRIKSSTCLCFMFGIYIFILYIKDYPEINHNWISVKGKTRKNERKSIHEKT